jgi:hypothetical protein
MKSTATVFIATALAVIAAATVFIALQVSVMADRLERLEAVTGRNCMTGTMTTLTQWANGREDIVQYDLLAEVGVFAESWCKQGDDEWPIR